MDNFFTVGICKVQADPVLCDTGLPDPDRTAHVIHNIINIDENERIEDGITITEESGVPGVNCINLELPGETLSPELVITTTSVVDPSLETIASTNREAIYAVDGTFLGINRKKKAEANCFCACGEAEDAPCNRWNVTVWSKALCPGGGSSAHPNGEWYINRYPNVEFLPNSQTRTLSNLQSGAREYLALSHEAPSPGWRGPQDMTPVEYDLTTCGMGFFTDICPPGECGCGGCDQVDAVPLARSARGAVEAPVEDTVLLNADELLAA